MSTVLEVRGLSKAYPMFSLKNISFKVESGRIVGLLGNAGSGKSTIMKSLLRMIYPDHGDAAFFGTSFTENERPIRQRTAYIAGGVNFFRKRRIEKIVDAMSTLYDNWDPLEFERYRDKFGINLERTPAELTPGMRVKLNIALAMGHRSRLLLLDQPTAGMEPLAREELTDCFWYMKTQGITVLFSSEFPSDIEKCADDIIYLRDGEIVSAEPVVDFIVFHRQMRFGSTLDEIITKYNNHEVPPEVVEELQKGGEADERTEPEPAAGDSGTQQPG